MAELLIGNTLELDEGVQYWQLSDGVSPVVGSCHRRESLRNIRGSWFK